MGSLCYKIFYKLRNASKKKGQSLYTGQDLKSFRETRDWSLRRFSAIVGVSVKTLQVMEKENKPIPLQLRLALAAIKEGVHPIE